MMKKLLISFIFVIFLLSPFSFNANLNFSLADTDIYYQPISSDTTWDMAGSPYIIHGDVVILPGATLTIGPGVIIKVRGASLTVRGRLNVLGEAGRPVIFTSINDDARGGHSVQSSGQPAVGDWGVIKTLASGSLNFNHAVINYGGWESIAQVNNRNIIKPNIAYAFINTGVIKSTGGQVEINNSEIARNEKGIFSETDNGQVSVHNCKIYDNASGGIINYGAAPVDAINNWWGDNSGPYQAILNPQGRGNLVSDNVLFDPWIGKGTVQAPDPVIIVPGIGACLNLKVMTGLEESSWDWDLVGDYYQGLIKTLEAAGFTQGENLFIGCYDWRQTNGFNPDAAVNSGEEYLRHWIDLAKEKSGARQVDIIAHSMGGLVARSYIQSDRYQNDDVDQLIMLGTPNHGASDTYYAWEGGEIPKSWSEFRNKIILYLTLLKFKGLSVTNIAAIHKFIPSIKQLLPTYDYLFDTAQQIFVPKSAIVETNNWLNNLNDEAGIAKLGSRVRAQIIYGDGKDTLNEIPISARDALDIQSGKWIDGKPVAEQVEYQPSGDGTVMNTSAQLSGIVSEALPSIEHSALLDQAALKIMQALGIQSEQVFSSPPDTKSELMFLVASPVFPLVTTPDGTGQIGYDAATGGLINTIEGARYFSAGDSETKLIIIPKPVDGEYSLELTANADGEYHLASGYFSDTQSIVKETVGEVADEQVINYPVNLQSNAGGDNILPELAPEKEEDSVVINRVIADIEAMLKKGLIINKQSAQELIQPLKQLNRQLSSIDKQTARIKKWIDKINANTKMKPKIKEKILQALNKRLAKLPAQRAKFIERNLASFNKNLENLKKKNKITIEGYNSLIKSINILRKTL